MVVSIEKAACKVCKMGAKRCVSADKGSRNATRVRYRSASNGGR